MLLNIFVRYLLFHVKRAKTNADADHHEVCYSYADPVDLDACVSHDVSEANEWYNEKRMLVNESNHQSLVLGDTDYFFVSRGYVTKFWNGIG